MVVCRMRVPLLSCLLVVLPCQATKVFVCRRPEAAEVVSFLNKQASIDNQLNHNFAGITESFLEYDTKRQLPDHMKVILLKADLGCGRSVYKCAKAHLLKWNLHAGSQTAGIMTKADTRGRPEYLATFAKTLGGLAWCVNPCRVQYRLLNKPYRAAARATVSGLQTATAYCTLRGHLFEGEERVRVVWEKRTNNAVCFEVLSVSRGHGILVAQCSASEAREATCSCCCVAPELCRQLASSISVNDFTAAALDIARAAAAAAAVSNTNVQDDSRSHYKSAHSCTATHANDVQAPYFKTIRKEYFMYRTQTASVQLLRCLPVAHTSCCLQRTVLLYDSTKVLQLQRKRMVRTSRTTAVQYHVCTD
eukprot:11230-Heterococcus_DN1.PRE.2